jgi:hypothetical protein
MNNYKEQPRLIFRDTIQKNLIGPGSDVFSSNNEEEIISDYPLSRYFSGILFPEREIDIKKDSIGLNIEVNTNAETEDGEDNQKEFENDNTIESEEVEEKFDKKLKEENDNEYSEANQYFPSNFGLTFCVSKETKKIDIAFSFAKYKQIKPVDAKIIIDEKVFKDFINHPLYPLGNVLIYDNGFMSLNKDSFSSSGLSVYTLKERFKQQEQQAELINTVVYRKVELLLGRLWERVKQEPLLITLNLNENNEDEAKEFSLIENSDNKKILTCYYKKIYETNYGKFVMELL